MCCNTTTPICLLILIGIPSSGKSFFRIFLEKYFNSHFDSLMGAVKMCTICYDDYGSVRNAKESDNESSWKSRRLELLKIVEKVIWFFKDNIKSKFCHIFPTLTIINELIVKPDSIIILVDDNMYYRSMRYDYYKLSKQFVISFAEIYFDIKLEEALKSNNSRKGESRVPDCVIKNMFDKIEHPLKRNSWEANSIAIKSYSDFQNKQTFTNILNFLKCSLNSPAVLDSRSLERFEAKEITNLNVLHQIDNALKQLVGVCIKNHIETKKSAKEIEKISKLYSEKRLTLLKQIKVGNIVIPLDLSKSANKDDMNKIKLTLLEHLKS